MDLQEEQISKKLIWEREEIMSNKSDPSKPIRTMKVPDNLGRSFWKQTNRFHFIYSLFGLLIGAIFIILGIVLFFHGVGGSVSWTAKILGLESQISDAPPGVVLFVVGLFVIFVTRYSVEAQKE